MTNSEGGVITGDHNRLVTNFFMIRRYVLILSAILIATCFLFFRIRVRGRFRRGTHFFAVQENFVQFAKLIAAVAKLCSI